MKRFYEEASVHGRFQPPHLQHLEYILSAKRRCRFLWIGITRYLRSDPKASTLAPHRNAPASNPLTYFERSQLIRTMLRDSGVSVDDFSIIPFPIDEPQLLQEFMPRTIPCLTTVYDQWNEEKIRILQALGYEVDVLYRRTEKTISGQLIRQLILSQDPKWHDLVPTATIAMLETMNIRSRLIAATHGE